jgi:hypothetical protein
MHRFNFALLALLLILVAQPLVAATYYVGSCKAGAYSTISAAVAAVPSGSTIDVCPGTYPEQVVISQPLTLQGIVSNNSSQAVITVPSGGLTTTPSIFWGTVAAQVQVMAGPVNITNITVDGAGPCPGSGVGIYYASGSSGTMNGVEARNVVCPAATGLMAENGAGVNQTVKIENSNIHDNRYAGIFTCTDQLPSTLTVSISGNSVAGGKFGIVSFCNTAGTVAGNFVSGAQVGIESTSATVSGNTISAGIQGIKVWGAASITSNHISHSPTGIILFDNNATIKTNAITNSNIGIEFSCFTGTITGNTINGAATGFDQVPVAFNGVNKFYNVSTVRVAGGC